MKADPAAIERQALALPAAARQELAQKLWASLEPDSELDEAWASEIERRVAEVERGASSFLSLDEELARIRAALR